MKSLIKTLLGKKAQPSGSSFWWSGTPAPISPAALLENLIPGYAPVHKFLLYSFGFDVTVLVSFGAALWLAIRVTLSVWRAMKSLIAAHWTSEISVHSGDEMYSYLKLFWAFLDQEQGSRRLQAEIKITSTWDMTSEVIERPGASVEEGNTKFHNFSKQAAQSQPNFTPALGKHIFWYKNVRFTLESREDTLFRGGLSGKASILDKKSITVYCAGRSAVPIKNLLSDAKDHYYHGRHTKTVIKRPASEDSRRFIARDPWNALAERPCRSLNTVVLDKSAKEELLNDMNEYLNPGTAIWYANRGIPYRRGYLFYGPPGTGKSSLTFVLAGIFGLAIHVVSLRDPTLTEDVLGALFMALPARCIVLLEDIDAAGLMRDEPKSDRTRKVNKPEGESRISLAGLLNIIDGRFNSSSFCNFPLTLIKVLPPTKDGCLL